MNQEVRAQEIGTKLDEYFKQANDFGFDLEQCCSKHILIVDRATGEVMYEVDVKWQ